MASDDAALRHAIKEHALYLGFDPDIYPELLPIAKEALLAPLPPGWKEATDAKGNVYYYNASTKASVWEHPLDAAYRQNIQTQLLKLRGKQSISSSDSKQSQDEEDSDNEVPVLRTPGRSQVSNLQGSKADSAVSSADRRHVLPVSPGSLSEASAVGSVLQGRARQDNGPTRTAGPGARRAGDVALGASASSSFGGISGSNAFAAAQQSLRRAEAKLAGLQPLSTPSSAVDQLTSSQLDDEDLIDGSVSGAGAGGRRLSISQRLVRLVSTIKSEGLDASVRAEREASRADRADREAQHENETIQQLLAGQAALVAERNVALAELEAARGTIERLRSDADRVRAQGQSQGQDGSAQVEALQRELADLRRVHDAEVQRSEQLRVQLHSLSQDRAAAAEQVTSAQKETSSFHALAQAEREGRQRAEDTAMRLETQVQVLQDQLTHAQGHLGTVREKHERDLSALREQLASAKETVAAQTRQWEQALTVVQGKVSLLEGQLQEQIKQNSVLQSEVDGQRASLTMSQDQHTLIQQVQAQLAAVQQQLQSAEQELTDARNGEELLRVERDSLQSRLQEASSQLASTRQESLQLHSDLASASQARASAQEELNRKAQEAIELQVRVTELQLDLQASLAREDTLQTALSSRPATTPIRPARAEASMSPLMQARDIVSPGRLQQTEQRVAELQHAVDVLTGELAEAQAMVQAKGREVDAQVQARGAEQAEYAQKLQLLEAQLAKTTATATQLSRLQAQLDASDVEISALRAELLHVSGLAEQVPDLRSRLAGETDRAEGLHQQLQEATATQGQIRELEQRLQRASSLSDELLRAKAIVSEVSTREAALLVRVQQLEAEVAVAQAGSVAASTALLEAKSQLLQQTAVVQELTDAVQGHLSRQESVEVQLAQAREQAVAAQARADEQQAAYEEELQTLNASIAALRVAATSSETRRAEEQAEHERRLGEMKRQQSTLQQRLEEAMSTSKAASDLVEKLQAAASKDQATIVELRQAVLTAQVDLSARSQLAHMTQSQAQQQVAAAQAELAVAVGSIAELESKVTSMSAERASLQAQIAAFEAQTQAAAQRAQEEGAKSALLAAQVQTLEARLQNEVQSLASASATIKELQGQLDSATAERQASLCAMSELRSSHEVAAGEARTRLQAMEKELASLHTALSAAKTDASTALFMRDKAEAEVQSLSDELTRSAKLAAQLEADKDVLLQEKVVAIGAVDRALQEGAATAEALTKAEERVSVLQTELDSMQKLAEAGSSVLQRQVLELRSQLELSREDAAAAALAAQEAAAQVALLQSQHESASAAASAERSSALAKAVAEGGRARVELASAVHQVNSLQSELLQSKAECEELAHRVDGLVGKLEVSQREATRAASESVAAAHIAEEARKDLGRLKAEVQQAQVELEAMRASADEAAVTAISERDAAVQEARGLRQQLSDVESLLSAVRAEAQGQAGEHAKVLLDLQAQQDEEVSALQGELTAVRASLDEERSASASLQSRLVSLEAHLTDRQRQYSQQMQAAEEQVAALSVQLQTTQDLVIQLNADVETVRQSGAESVSRVEGEKAELQSMLFRAESEASTLRERSAALEGELAATKADAQEMAAATAELHASAQALQSSLAHAQARVTELEQAVRSKSEQVQQQQEEIQALVTKQADMQHATPTAPASLSTASVIPGSPEAAGSGPGRTKRHRGRAGRGSSIGAGMGVPSMAESETEVPTTVQLETLDAPRETEDRSMSPGEEPSPQRRPDLPRANPTLHVPVAAQPMAGAQQSEDEVVAMSPASPEPAVRGKAGRRVGAFTPGSPSPPFRSPAPVSMAMAMPAQAPVHEQEGSVALSPVTMKARQASEVQAAAAHSSEEAPPPPHAGVLPGRSVRSASMSSTGTGAGTGSGGGMGAPGRAGAAEIHVHLHGLSAGEASSAIVQPLDATQGVLGGFEVLLPPTKAYPPPTAPMLPAGEGQEERESARLPATSMILRSTNTSREHSFVDAVDAGGSSSSRYPGTDPHGYAYGSSPTGKGAGQQGALAVGMMQDNSLAVTLGPSSLRGIHSGDADLLGMARSAELSSSTLRLLQDLGVDFAGGGAATTASSLLSPYAHSSRASSDLSRPIGYWARKYGLDLPTDNASTISTHGHNSGN